MGALKVWDGTAWQTVANQGRPGSNVFVGPSTPPGTPSAGDLWYDTDEVSGLVLPITLANGGTGGTSAATARSSLGIITTGNSTGTAGAPTTGTYARGDQWLDSNNVLWTCTVAGTPGTWTPPIGYELAYNQITAGVSLTNGSGAQHLVVEGTSRTYDGSPVIVEFYSPIIQAGAGVNYGAYINLWDASTDLGVIGEVYNNTTSGLGATVHATRRIVPTAGTHNYRITGFVNAGTATVYAGVGSGGGNTFFPTYVRVIRA